jgi:hypothetical protein
VTDALWVSERYIARETNTADGSSFAVVASSHKKGVAYDPGLPYYNEAQ